MLLTLAPLPASPQSQAESSAELPSELVVAPSSPVERPELPVEIEPEFELISESLAPVPDPVVPITFTDRSLNQPSPIQETRVPPIDIDDQLVNSATSSRANANNIKQEDQQQAPQQSASSTSDSSGVPDWHTRLLMHLERHKRYPRSSVQRRQQGVVEIQFIVDRMGYVLHKRLVNSSGSVLLDRSALKLIERAQPLPAPPVGIPDGQLDLTVPIRFFLN